MGNITKLIVAIIVLTIINTALRLAFDFFEIKPALYVDYLGFADLMIVFIAVLPDKQGLIIEKIYGP